MRITEMFSRIKVGVVAIVLFLVAGCGGGGGGGVGVTPTGRATFTLQWATRSRIVGAAANSVRIEILNGNTRVTEQLPVRPAGGSATTVVMDSLPVGNLTARMTAYPQSDGTGNPVGKADAPCVITAGGNTQISVDPNSTVDRLEITPTNTSLAIKQTYTINVVAKDTAGAIVLVWPSKIQYTSETPGIATVNSNGVVTAQGLGTTNIIVTDTESNKTTTLSVKSTIDHLELSPPSLTLRPGQQQGITVVAKDFVGGNIALPANKLQYLSANTAVATVNATGIVSAIALGTTQIKVTEVDSQKFVNLSLTVNNPLALAFGSPNTYAVPSATDWITTTDFDGDGNPDVAVGGNVGLYVLYGKGDGTLGPVTTATNVGASNRAVADVNKDGRPDIICNVNTTLRVLLNLGGRNWATPIDFPHGTRPHDIAVGDFNGDGAIDLAVVNNTSPPNGTLAIYLNDGTGHFTPGASYQIHTPLGCTVADINKDGRLDIGVGYYSNGTNDGVQIFMGNGNGTFTPTANYPGGNVALFPVFADFNKDGRLDLAFSVVFSDRISVYTGIGNGTFTGGLNYATTGYPSKMFSADVDLDGSLDIVSAHNGHTVFSVLRNQGNGIFAAPVAYPAGGGDTRSIALADFNKDGKMDVAAQNQGSNSVSIILNTSR